MRAPIFRGRFSDGGALAAFLGAALLAWAWAPGMAHGAQATVERRVRLPDREKLPAVVVTAFYTQGALRPDGSNLLVQAGDQLVAWRVLQVGPGDFCRVAFRTVHGRKVYTIRYGGPAVEKAPPWPAASPGLLLETRKWRWCDPNSLDSVRKALATAELIGSDFVPAVFHRYNPFWPDPEPFLSVYRGNLRIDVAGLYRFFTSSQDCSFLLIDDKVVVAAPGWHGPTDQARIKGEIGLTVGGHRFAYYHMANGGDACMVAAWQPPRAKAPRRIPAEVFGNEEVAHLRPGQGLHETRGVLPDFEHEVLGEVPLADVPEPLLRVRFTAVGSTRPGSAHWDFGDGQISDQAAPVHVYMGPGLYTVKLTVGGRQSHRTAVNRVFVHRAVVLPGPQHRDDQLADYLPILRTYDASMLSLKDLLQLVRAYDQLDKPLEAARLGKAGLLSRRAREDEAIAYDLVKLVGPMLRDRLDDPMGAREAWLAAAKVIRNGERQAECAVEAADISLHDLLLGKEVQPLLESATTQVKKLKRTLLETRLHCLWGDWYARTGGPKEAPRKARAAYALAGACQGPRGNSAEQLAQRGALSRSTEAFLRDQELDRARDELRRWEERFPEDKIEGYLTLLLARYQTARGKHARVLALADELVVINPDSPYADQLVFLAAECAAKMGRKDRARAGFQTVLTDYPGSPLVAKARARLAGLKGNSP